ncbi:glycogen debranching N-terminal domain-containing protein [Thermopolyspora sp. NPDC052614]|uniref:glycogen debranching N-terminal domain-containing protein n=1 Tax=Thermopolyspora sp. NPDC052614 TaxID=3155682 RepID=UPI0034267C0B
MDREWVPEPMVGEAVICVAAPSMALSCATGQIGEAALDGFYHSDRRLVGRLRVTVDGREPEPLRHRLLGAAGAEFLGVHRTPFDQVTGPVVTIRRIRDANALSETIILRNLGRQRLSCRVRVEAGSDLAELSRIRSGRPPAPLPAAPVPDGMRWDDDGGTATITAVPGPDEVDAEAQTLSWSVTVERGQEWTLALSIDHTPSGVAGPGSFARADGEVLGSPVVRSRDSRLVGWWERSLADLRELMLADAAHPEEVFAAAGAPWYLTLFGRDAIWTARMLLPLGTRLAEGTLRALARRQGERYDPVAEEAPGKIVHEVRRTATTPYEGLALPPLYYGTIDATPLFVSLLAEAWRWGLPAERVAGLLPAAERALTWLRTDADPDGDGFCEYINGGATGLANQGWKDSPDAIQFADGAFAKPPIALAEVQGYAYRAAVDGADLLAAFGRPGADAWREWAARLRERFRERFWVRHEARPYIAIALDASKRPVDGVASNMGHLLGLGLLDPGEEALVADRLAGSDMDSGCGLRTLSGTHPGFNPISYHCGSVWAHDTAIAVSGLAASGHGGTAAALFAGVSRAAAGFGHRLPELWSGEGCAEGEEPLPYPGACRPQAWAAAAVVHMLIALAGIRPDVPNRRIEIRPVRPWPLGAIDIVGLTVAGEPLSVRIAADGSPSVLTGPGDLRFVLS